MNNFLWKIGLYLVNTTFLAFKARKQTSSKFEALINESKFNLYITLKNTSTNEVIAVPLLFELSPQIRTPWKTELTVRHQAPSYLPLLGSRTHNIDVEPRSTHDYFFSSEVKLHRLSTNKQANLKTRFITDLRSCHQINIFANEIVSQKVRTLTEVKPIKQGLYCTTGSMHKTFKSKSSKQIRGSRKWTQITK